MNIINKTELTAPDAIIIVEGDFNDVSHFYAHSFVLSSYSGYFKSWLQSSSTSSSKIVKISAIRPEIFGALLTFMYTGVLDLNYSNVYEILLAANLLHVPTISELCKSYLTNIVYDDGLSTNKTIVATNDTTTNTTTISTRLHYPPIIKPIPMKRSITSLDRSEDERIIDSKKKIEIFESSIFKPLVKKLKSDFDETRRRYNSRRTRYEEDKNDDTTSLRSSANRRSNIVKTDDRQLLATDVASCDGPIKFSKVLNDNYKPGYGFAETNNNNVSNGEREKYKEDTRPYDERRNEKQETRRGRVHPQNGLLQYYACKSCGAKFPSYYFVHKHKKLYHETENNDKEQKTVKKIRK